MAAVTPTSANHCRGNFADGTPNIKLKCVGSFDNDGLPVYNCSTWRFFRVNCAKINQQCSNLSGAWVPAITVCGQKLG